MPNDTPHQTPDLDAALVNITQEMRRNTTRVTGVLPLLPLALLAWLLAWAPPAAAGSYTFIPLQIPGALCTSAAKLNARGQIVGGFCAEGWTSGSFLWDGTFTRLLIADSTSDAALGINARGQVVGTYADPQGANRAIILFTLVRT
jgi:hypothetical protein